MLLRLPLCVALIAAMLPQLGHAQAKPAATSKQAAPSKAGLTDKMATSICDCLEKKQPAEGQKPLTKESAQNTIVQCFGVTAGKEMKTIQQAYGPSAFNDKQVMNNLGRDVGALMLQTCPTFMSYSMIVAGHGETASSTAATTGQTTGEWASLGGTATATVNLNVGKTDKAEFVWSRHFPKDDELLGQLDKLKGRQVKVSWEEVEVFRADTKQYRKQREITSIELL
jgi:hypothetical protein